MAIDPDTRRELVASARFGRKPRANGEAGMAITSHPISTRIATDVLRRGGNACDAALAAAAAQTVVEPHMTTITGVLGLLWHEGATGETTYLNASIDAPLAPLPGFSNADLATGRGVAVPGWFAGFDAAASRWGTLTRAELLAPAIRLAREGFEVHAFLYGMLFWQAAVVGKRPEGREIYFRDGRPIEPGELLVQARAADTLDRLAELGSEEFYRGEFAQRFCDVVQGAGGVITRADLERYEVRWQAPARGTYRDYEVVGSPPPDAGGMHVIEALNMLELLDLAKLGHPTESAETLYQMMLISQAVVDDGRKLGDPATHDVPMDLLTSKEHARMRLALLQMGSAREATPPVHPGTTHVTVVDREGNAASLLHSCSAMPWENALFVDGISICAAAGHFLRVMPRPGERSTKYVAPSMLLKHGKPALVMGSPSVSIVANLIQNTVNLVDFGLDIEESVSLPRYGNASTVALPIEVDFEEDLRDSVAKRGLRTELVSPWNMHLGSFEGIWIDPETGERSACADPRRSGAAEAE